MSAPITAICIALLALVGCTAQRITGPTVHAAHGVVVSVSAPASEVGRDTLERGGNAVDAAIATAFALAVTFPEAGNIGGGGFMLIYPASGGRGQPPIMIDYRETAPAAATPDMFATGPKNQARLVGIPGTVAGLALAHQRYGHLPWRDLLAPAIQLADKGFTLNQALADSLNRHLERPGDEAAEMRRVLAKPDHTRWTAGDKLLQPELAQTLRQIADHGPDAFYKGPLADALVDTLKPMNGIVTQADLAAYEPKLRQPMHGNFRGYDLYGPPPPTSGGICILEMLNILEPLNLRQNARWSPQALHLIIETMRRAYLDRARYLGDPDFTEIPPHLLMKSYARAIASQMNPGRATPSAELATPDIPLAPEPDHTTHFSVLDSSGMAVSNTFTLEQAYGSRIMVKGHGFLLNNEMGDFNPRPGVTDKTGRIGTTPNLVAPGKRMLSSMSPFIVTKNGRVVMVTGSPGGRTIINTVLCVLLNRLEFNMPPRECIDAPRLSQTWLPDVVSVEPGMLKDHADAIAALKQRGHIITEKPTSQGDANSIFVTDNGILGIADQRRNSAAAGY